MPLARRRCAATGGFGFVQLQPNWNPYDNCTGLSNRLRQPVLVQDVGAESASSVGGEVRSLERGWCVRQTGRMHRIQSANHEAHLRLRLRRLQQLATSDAYESRVYAASSRGCCESSQRTWRFLHTGRFDTDIPVLPISPRCLTHGGYRSVVAKDHTGGPSALCHSYLFGCSSCFAKIESSLALARDARLDCEDSGEQDGPRPSALGFCSSRGSRLGWNEILSDRASLLCRFNVARSSSQPCVRSFVTGTATW